MQFTAHIKQDTRPQVGLVVLQADETIEDELRPVWPRDVSLLVSRVPSGLDVSPETLSDIQTHLAQAVALFPLGKRFDVIGFACTSATAEIGAHVVAEIVQKQSPGCAVTDPLTALIATCQNLNITRLGFVSPYVESVSNKIRDRLAQAGIDTPHFGSFHEAEEARVARIDGPSIAEAAQAVAAQGECDAVFLSCTNLRTAHVQAALQQELGIPVLSSNSVMAWHMLQLSGAMSVNTGPDHPLTSSD